MQEKGGIGERGVRGRAGVSKETGVEVGGGKSYDLGLKMCPETFSKTGLNIKELP